MTQLFHLHTFFTLLFVFGVAVNSAARLSYSSASKHVGFTAQANNTIYYSNGIDVEFKAVFSGNNNLLIISHRIDPNGNYIAIRTRNMGREYPIDYEPNSRYGEDFLIINRDGKILYRFEFNQLLSFDWDSKGERIVCLTGSYERFRKLSDFPLGNVLHLFDIHQGELQQVVADTNEIFLDASWAVFDDNIYLRKLKGVFRYDIASSKMIPMTFKSANISPNGKYCFLDDFYGKDGAELYLTGSEQQVALITPEKIKQSSFERPDLQFISSLKLFDWIIDGNKTYAIVFDTDIAGCLKYFNLSGFWKLDCETGLAIELPVPKYISQIWKAHNYQLPAGLQDGKLVWALPTPEGNLKASFAE